MERRQRGTNIGPGFALAGPAGFAAGSLRRAGMAIFDFTTMSAAQAASLVTISGGANARYFDASGNFVAAGGALRLDTDPITLQRRGLLIERQQRVCVSLDNRDFTTANWTRRGTISITADAGQARPDGTTGAMKIVGLAGAGSADFYDANYAVASRFPASKRIEPAFFVNRISTTGILTVTSALGTASGRWDVNLASLSAGWNYITRSHPSVTIANEFVANASGQNGFNVVCNTGAPISLYLDFLTLETDGTNDTLIAGLPIVVNTANGVTRTAEAAFMSSIARFIGPAGTLFIDAIIPPQIGAINYGVMAALNAAGNYTGGSGFLVRQIAASIEFGGYAASSSIGAPSSYQPVQVVATWGGANMSGKATGLSVVSSALNDFTAAATDRLELGALSAWNTQAHPQIWVRKIGLAKTAYSAAQMARLAP